MKQLLSRRRTLLAGSFVLIAIALTTILFLIGVRVGAFGIGFVGSLAIQSNTPLTILVDNRVVKSTYKDGVVRVSTITPTAHTIIVASEDGSTWPWARDVLLTSGETVTLDPTLVPKEPRAQALSVRDSEYYRIPLYIERTPRTLEHAGRTISLLEGGSIVEEARGEQALLFDGSRTPVRAILPYRGEPNTIVVALGDGVYALDISGDTPQNFAPLYKGIEPKAGDAGELGIAIWDGSYRILLSY